ncbi:MULTISPECIES: spore germination protein [unclassified Paenibacillus]|uniref:spore germination protein n=1 Tax=unclassified Paenibacillus TaxID=185978 RepID=UPI001AE437B5|nr:MULTISPECIES: spore germination protein [unclassified Paenibacillus]MBP1155811.1 spore germination protein KA [Paenibacillus sp. PvP091]MBP1168803.1 spore germination protein KA [Paenibacillus sp. PvR098]MBP2439831.1 spore germination protein KA [Paenibacillus sp. PvP052]
MKLFRKWIKKKLSHSPNQKSPQIEGSTSEISLDTRLNTNIDVITQRLGNSTDLMIRHFIMGDKNQQNAAILYFDGITDTKSVLEPLVMILHEQSNQQVQWPIIDAEDFIQRLFVPVGSVKMVRDMTSLLKAILSGDTAILFDGLDYGVIAGSRQWKERSIEEPNTESVVRGPRDGFTESLRTNTSLLRKRIKNPDLWMETLQIGRVTQTDVAMMYINGIASPKVVDEVRTRLNSIDIDSILESGYIEEFIQDKTLTVFPLVYNSERPDVISAELLEGRVAILVDGTPFVLIVPALFVQFLQASEDHYQRWDFATFIRLIRYASLGIALVAPALYVAIITFHQEILPPQLLMNLIAAREDVPFPAFVEAMIMEITFEILREAGVRMPKTVGQAVSIVGTLVIGQAAVEAGLVSPAMVIIVSLTAIANFVIPSYSIAISLRLLRFFMMMLAGSLGIFGILLGLFIIVFHLCSLRSFGVPYLSTFAPFHLDDQKDAILRVPRWAMFSRPFYTKNRNYIRIGSETISPNQDLHGKDSSNS